MLEGYGPPVDPRLQTLSVTPDPGVIEVNIQPLASWDEQVDGDHHALRAGPAEPAGHRDVRRRRQPPRAPAAATTSPSAGHARRNRPLLRRPDLLVSLLTHWQRHPSLSYLFSGQFIGPTAQAPRADEGRRETLYEMEIAFSEIARQTREDGTVAPWVVDRALRHLLTDITGNTHRAEFCIDKLYSPDSARGRLGLLELRGFEMPPHAQMALVQALLVRSLVSRFWDDPLQAPLVRHGDDLHGRYLLPHYVIADIAEVAADLRAHGIDFQTSWLDPFTEFRFPRLGSVTVGEMELELRWAIEPWHVLGEEATAGGTARYVDSSVERLQVSLTGAAGSGQVWVTCNGFPVPLRPTHIPGLQVAGVRYRAWAPPSSLHPTIPPDSPLVFDVVDAGSGVSLGGATYYVSHPGGRSLRQPAGERDGGRGQAHPAVRRGRAQPGRYRPHPAAGTGGVARRRFRRARNVGPAPSPSHLPVIPVSTRRHLWVNPAWVIRVREHLPGRTVPMRSSLMRVPSDRVGRPVAVPAASELSGRSERARRSARCSDRSAAGAVVVGGGLSGPQRNVHSGGRRPASL